MIVMSRPQYPSKGGGGCGLGGWEGDGYRVEGGHERVSSGRKGRIVGQGNNRRVLRGWI